MAEISAQVVKSLRQQTGAGMMDCKRALADAGGDLERARQLLRERGLHKAGKREGRATSEGAVAMALAEQAAGLIELGCETDFVAKTPEFQSFAGELARAVAGDAKLESAEALRAAPLDGQTVEGRLVALIAKLGENVVPKRVARLTVPAPGVVGGYVHAGGKLGVVVGLATEARGSAVEGLAKDVAMHVAAADPTPVAVDRGGIPSELVEKEREIFRAQAEQSGKPEKVLDRIVEGRLGKFYAEACLLEQSFVKDPDRTVAQVLEEVGKKVESEISITGFERFRLGESEGA